ncbi:hypothetical protein HDU91_002517 [Kappamyces sp. JEL0680]|nr:hypothetical protein HDU91_002517 [Kappamyces sp. JEL0680]
MKPIPRPDDIAIVFSDVDGTLLNENHVLLPKTATAITQLRQLRPELPFVICTGKQRRAVQQQLNEPLVLDGFPSIHINGSLLHGPRGAVLHSETLSYELLHDFVNEFYHSSQTSRKRITLSFYDMEHVYQIVGEEATEDWGARLQPYGEVVVRVNTGALLSERQLDIQRFLEKIQQGQLHIYKATFCEEPGSGLDACRHYLESHHPPGSFQLVQALDFCLEVIPTGGSKGKAVQRLLAILGIQPSQAICFGDGQNDKSMFEFIARGGGWAVAMGNAMEVLQQSATNSTLSNADDGVGHFLAQVFDLPCAPHK